VRVRTAVVSTIREQKINKQVNEKVFNMKDVVNQITYLFNMEDENHIFLYR
jgi:hypothetical protein